MTANPHLEIGPVSRGQALDALDDHAWRDLPPAR